MKRIPLTQDKFALVDDEDYEIISQYRWHAMKIGRRFYARNAALGYMHRFLIGEPGKQVDHKDMDGLNNTRANIRSVDKSANSSNKLYFNSHGFPGVGTSNKKYFTARLIVGKRTKYLGSFKTKKKPPKHTVRHTWRLSARSTRFTGAFANRLRRRSRP